MKRKKIIIRCGWKRLYAIRDAYINVMCEFLFLSPSLDTCYYKSDACSKHILAFFKVSMSACVFVNKRWKIKHYQFSWCFPKSFIEIHSKLENKNRKKESTSINTWPFINEPPENASEWKKELPIHYFDIIILPFKTYIHSYCRSKFLVEHIFSLNGTDNEGQEIVNSFNTK